MISFISQKTGQMVHYQKGQKLGEGAIGAVVELLDNDGNETALVCKTVELSNDGRFSKRLVLTGTINEIRILKKLGLLEGYYRRGDKLYVVMSKVEGVVEADSLNPNKQWYSYRALRALHRQNIAHLDAHQKNVIIGNNHATTIDYNFASEGTYLNCVLDSIGFFLARKKSLKDLVGWYVCDTLRYISEHKFETAQNLLLMGALTLSAIYGIPALYITNVMMWELFLAMAKVQLAKEVASPGFKLLAALSASFLLHDFELSAKNHEKIMEIFERVFEPLQSCFSIYFLYSDIAYNSMNHADLLQKTLNRFQDAAWRDLFCQSTVGALHQASLIYLPLRQLISTSCDFVENQVLPKFALKAEADLFFYYSPGIYAKAKSFVFSDNSESTAHPKPCFV